MGSHYKRVNNETALPNHQGEADQQNQTNTKLHGNSNSSRKNEGYLHRFKIIESPDFPCGGGNQTVDHVLYDCTKLQREREKLTSNISNQDKWPVNKCDLVKKHIKYFIQFADSINFEKL